jgi:anti-sigma factor RsiW
MNCKRAQAQIALAVGGDLDDAAERELHKHLDGCVECHRHWRQMNDTWALLLDREDELPDPHDSVWPDLQVKLPSRRALMSRARFNGWTVALAMAAICLAMVSMWRTANTSEPMLGPEQITELPQLDVPRIPEGWSPQPGFRQPQLHEVDQFLSLPANEQPRRPLGLRFRFEGDPALRYRW